MSEQAVRTQPFPLYYAKSAPFLLDTTPSGAEGAVARLTIQVNNRPQTITSVRFANTYRLSGDTDPMTRIAFRLALDDEQLVGVQITAQNITFPEVHQRTLQGLANFNQHPLLVGYQLRGANKIQFTATRLMDYPQVQDLDVEPYWHVTVCSIVHWNDQQAGRAPGSFRPAS